ncbi:MAG: hypothetical protein AMXMBFR36_26080 [Acidobacteriota bacterium]
MNRKIGEVEALFRYPVKSMSGEPLEAAALSWHGLDGDRRLAFRRVGDRSGFPWLTAGKLPELILHAPRRAEGSDGAGPPSHVRTPDGQDLDVFGPELAKRIGDRHGSPVEMTYLDRGIFDEASVSLITSASVAEAGRLAARRIDVRRFRPNILIASDRSIPFEEDQWIHGVLTFGEDADGAAIAVTNHDERCAMVNFDPDSGETDKEVLKAIVRARKNRLGVYGTVTRPGRLGVGQSVYFEPRREEGRLRLDDGDPRRVETAP